MNNSRNQLAVSLATALLGAGMAIVASSAIVGLGSGAASARTTPAHRVPPTPRFGAVVFSGDTVARTKVRMTAGTVDATETASRAIKPAQDR
ncbi:hypothetical protein [Tropicimonas sp. IMCC6043]|uniref:hypothetical protein n=1 Tax=Tropicimonas sp. IMCC6043 TaxID=2510645 RepID=UPI00101CE05C|nr:hypothetical protein [Tropicimonas sp. IMCC6043]RYH10440.1 hypothetical protein EU800_09170 [Tropicimonas sp. IMCC6043]